MSAFKKLKLDMEAYHEPVLLHLIGVRIPANLQTYGHIRLDVADGDSNHLTVKPHNVYQCKPSKRTVGSEIVFSVDAVISFQGTHFILEIFQLSTLHQHKTITKLAVLLLDILYIMKQSDQEVVQYGTGQVKLDIKKGEESVGILQQVVLSQSLLGSLGQARAAVELLARIGFPLGLPHQTLPAIFNLIQSVVAELKHFDKLQPAIKAILTHMKTALDVVLDYNISSCQKLSFKFENLLQEYNFALQLDIAYFQNKLLLDEISKKAAQNQIKAALKKLHYVEIIAGDQCLADTRVSMLADIKHWAQENKAPVLWLYGPAGTGKSTIAATVASQLKRAERLAAFYTCKRNHEALGNSLQLWKNICYRLAIVHEPFGLRVAEVIMSDPHFGSGGENISDLFDTLFKQPLR
ncbi:hypothetical protein BDN72DRAFT_884111 [Pluteus cervinus]|uniref:Uncharacterized protein n=1 Tax=Pluteus cervinus TaxID=181527 RepID=A0ACD2ZZ80_9AGAR|nr:hypothetical protein BDN72DRAFT_884111 [Pluteus cervinus]